MAKDFRIMFFDTEMSSTHNLVSLGYVITDINGNRLSESYFILKPTAPIMKSTVAIHGITTQMAKKEGIPLRKGLRIFEEATKQCSVICGYAVTNDLIVLANGYKMIGRNPSYANGHATIIDVAKLAEAYMVEKGCGNPGECPGLERTYAALFDGDTFNTHNALDDAKATERCFFQLLRQERFNLKAIVPFSHVLKIYEQHTNQAQKAKKS